MFEAESILGGLFGASGDGGVAAAGEVGAAADGDGIWRGREKLKHLNVMIEDTRGVVITARLKGKDSIVSWVPFPVTGLVTIDPIQPTNHDSIFLAQKRRVKPAGSNRGFGTITANYMGLSSEKITVATVNKITDPFYYVKPTKTTWLRRVPTADALIANNKLPDVFGQKNPTLKRETTSNRMRVVGTYGNSYYLVETGEPRKDGLNLMFVKTGEVKKWVPADDIVIKDNKTQTEMDDYAKTLYEIGKIYEATTGVPAALFAAQSCYESYYGQSNFARNRNNIFGWRNGDLSFTTFDSVQDCIDRYNLRVGRGSGQNPVYAGLHGGTLREWAFGIGPAGYCPDAGYGDELWDIMRIYGWR